MTRIHTKQHQKESLEDLLLALRRKINQSGKLDLLKHELTLSQLEVLWFIGPADKKSMENISTYLKITPPSATAMIEKMEKKGLVKRIRDKKDRRMVYIVLSTKTKKQIENLFHQKEIILDKLTSKLSGKDRADLERIIKILVAGN